jgi:hypothetical protein
MHTVLIIVPCGKSKVWDKHPKRGPTRAADAYSGTPFKLNRAYAERFGDAWIVLSAKYGFIAPDFQIPEPYDVAFTKPKTSPIAVDALRQQVLKQQLHRHSVVVGLGGAAYRDAIAAAFAPFPVRLAYPFAGLPIGKMMQATKLAIATGDSHFDRERHS